jgi:hypothetical protein
MYLLLRVFEAVPKGTAGLCLLEQLWKDSFINRFRERTALKRALNSSISAVSGQSADITLLLGMFLVP